MIQIKQIPYGKKEYANSVVFIENETQVGSLTKVITAEYISGISSNCIDREDKEVVISEYSSLPNIEAKEEFLLNLFELERIENPLP